MGHPDYRNCRECGRHASEVGPLSWTRLCGDCGVKLLRENAIGISTKRGIPYRRQQIGQVAAALKNPQLVNALMEAGAFPDLDDSTANT